MYAIFIFSRTCYARIPLRGGDATHRSTIQNRYDTDQHVKCLGSIKQREKEKGKEKERKTDPNHTRAQATLETTSPKTAIQQTNRLTWLATSNLHPAS